MKRIASLIIVLLLVLIPYGQVLGWNDDGDFRGPQPMADGTPWSDSLDDLSNVHTQPGGVVGIEVSGGNAHLMAGHDEGRITSVAITCPEGYRYDLVLLDADVPGNSTINISILDPSNTSSLPGFVNEPIPGFINMTGTDESIFRIGTTKYPKVQIQVNLIADGTDRPRLLAWSLYFIPLGEWSDDFLGTGKMTSFGGINITGSVVELDHSEDGGGASYDPYPPVLFPDGRGDVDVFYPTAGNDDYQNGATIANTASSRGIDSGDLDDDGYIDIVLTAGGNLNSMILWGSSSGKWSTSDKTDLVHLDPGTDAAIGDFNGDGALDVVISAEGGMVNDGSYFWLNNGDGSFDKDWDVKIANAGASSHVEAGDLNADGYDDVVFVKSLVMSAICYFGGVGGPSTIVNISFLQNMPMTARGDLCIEDIDGDGHLDVLFATVENMEAPIYLGGSKGPDTTPDYNLLLKGNPMDVSAGDINDDGYIDIAYTTGDSTGTGNQIEVFKGTSTGWNKNDKYEIASVGGVNPVELVDIDVDGYADIVTGETASFKLYMGGATWPTAADLTLAGLGNPQDVTVAVPSGGGGGGAFRGSFLTDPIPPPSTDMKWDILHLDATVPANTSVTITIQDNSQDPILGYQDIEGTDVDLSGISNPGEIYVKVALWSETNVSTPVLESLLVNWMDKMAWRDQFYGDVKTVSALGLGVADLMLRDTDDYGGNPRDSFIFASLRNDAGYNTRSVGFLDEGGWDYTSRGPIYFNTQGAMAVDSLDIDGDHFGDLIFASYGTSDGSYTGMSPLFLGSPAGWYETPYHSFPTTGARDVIMSDLNQDGYADVVFAQEQDWQGPFVKSTLFWGSESGWNATPDVEFSTTGASGVVAADLDRNGKDDLVFACYEGADYATDSMVFLQESAGFCGTVPSIRLPTIGARAVKAANLNSEDNYKDLVFANSYDGQTYEVNSYIYWNEHASGGTFDPTPTELPTIGAMDVAIWDFSSGIPGGTMDLIFANSRNATSGYKTESYYYKNGGGTFATTPDVRIPTEGAYSVASFGSTLDKEPIFACRNNGTTHSIPSVAMVGLGFQTPMEFPTIGAVDVMPFELNDGNHGGYLSKVITPDPTDDIGGFYTLRYSATFDDNQAGAISIMDAETGEKLAEIPISEGDQEWDLRGLFSYRDHPSIRVNINVTGLDGRTDFALDDLWLNWTERVMMAPIVVDLDLVNNTVLRTETISLWVNASDEYDYPEDLVVLIEHQLEGDTLWKTTMLGSLTFVDGIWWRDVSPDRFEALGEYHFRVNVTDTDRESSGYIDFPQTLEVLPNLPTEPRLIEATAGDGVISLEWRAPLETGDMPLSGYMVYRGLSEDELTSYQILDAFTFDLDDEIVVNGMTYYYAVQALSEAGDGPLSAVVNAIPLGRPGVPISFEVEAGNGQVVLSWEAPVIDGGTPVLGYNVFRGLEPGLLDWLSGVDVNTLTDSDVENGVTYHYMVTARNIVGEGLPSEVLSATPIGLPSAPGDLAASSGLREVQLTWLVPDNTGGGDLVKYIIYRGDDPDDLEILIEVGVGSTTYYDPDVTAGSTFHYRISAVSAAGEGVMSLSVSATPYGPPGPPLDLVVIEGDRKVTLTWATPLDDGAAIITGYVVSRGLTSGNLEEIATLGLVLEYVDSSADNGVTYYYSVAATNEAGVGTGTDVVEATPVEPAVVPGKVLLLNVEAKGTKAVLAWATPNDDGGSPVTGYVILRGETRDTMVEIDQVGVVLSYTDVGLDHGKTYYYSVRAVNDVGQGAAIDPQTVKVEKEESDGDGIPIAILIAVAATVVIAAVAMFMRPGRKGDGEQEAPPEDLPEDREVVPEEAPDEGSEEEEPRPEIVIEHIEVR